MNNRKKYICFAALGTVSFAVGMAAPPAANTRTVASQTLPAMDGQHLQMTAVEVTYPPGGTSTPHSHPCPVLGYVLQGSLRMQVAGGPLTTYKAGDSFYEAANGIHQVSANASLRKPARFLAYFLCDHSAPLSLAVPGAKHKAAAHE